MLHSRIFHRTLIGVVALILFLVITIPHVQKINISTTAKEYAMDVSSYQRDCHRQQYESGPTRQEWK